MKKVKDDDWFTIAVLFQIITSIVQLILPLIGYMNEEQAARLRVVVTVVTFVPAIVLLLLHHTKGLTLSFAFYFIFLIFNYTVYPDSEQFIKSSQAWTLTPIAILTALCMYNIRDYDRFWKLLLYAGRLSAVLAVIYLVAFLQSPYRGLGLYNMHFGYSLLLPMLYLFTCSNVIDKLLSILMLGIVLILGSRGSAGMAFFFYMLYLIFYSRNTIGKLFIPMLIIIPIAVSQIPKFIDVESSRTVALIMSGEVATHDSGRNEIYKIVEQKISEQPITGWGIGADRAFMDTYAHNFFLELTLHYGFIVATLIIFFIFVCLVRGLKPIRACKIGGWIFIVMLTFYGLLPLFVSSSYLIDYKFATFIGVLLSTFRTNYHVVLNQSRLLKPSHQLVKSKYTHIM